MGGGKILLISIFARQDRGSGSSNLRGSRQRFFVVCWFLIQDKACIRRFLDLIQAGGKPLLTRIKRVRINQALPRMRGLIAIEFKSRFHL
jgi:hypothetical protein